MMGLDIFFPVFPVGSFKVETTAFAGVALPFLCFFRKFRVPPLKTTVQLVDPPFYIGLLP